MATVMVDRILTPPLEEGIQHEFIDYSKKAKRHGHHQDVKDENDIRQVAGCLPLDLPNRRVLLITSRKKKNAWVLPKGGWEQDETQQHAAQRETWEEAGVKGRITRQLGVFEERTKGKNKLKAHHWIFEMHIDEVVKKWPERKKRDRRWFTFQEALIATRKHRYIQEALMHSSLNPDHMPISPRYSFEQDPSDDASEVPLNSKLSEAASDNSLVQAMKSIFI
ncbi:NUDIX hydrolase domain-like protein [Mycotypha africana]|uniref:NUDIX hydrolase domain-like protein n=1 Tax=Mycotypha africana TaxID=64632 RepID=UPI0023009DC9|nr:NUDIX hydrolase domain-like protein [Mycotypha africana]KAI8971911.1 NUDIX hydrolase domain-like protein [Mycotypha africana]